jgi:hypothetical protein
MRYHLLRQPEYLQSMKHFLFECSCVLFQMAETSSGSLEAYIFLILPDGGSFLEINQALHSFLK